MARAWYAYNNIGDPQLPSSYFYTSIKPNCQNGFVACAIYSEGGELSPSDLTENLQTYIANGLITGLAQPSGAGKKYVYMKPTS